MISLYRFIQNGLWLTASAVAGLTFLLLVTGRADAQTSVSTSSFSAGSNALVRLSLLKVSTRTDVDHIDVVWETPADRASAGHFRFRPFGTESWNRALLSQVSSGGKGQSVGRKVLGGVVGAVGGFFLGGTLGAAIEGNSCACDDPGLKGWLIGAPVGAVAGGIVGVKLASR